MITHCLPRFHSTPCRSSSFSLQSDRLEPRSSCWGEPCEGPTISQHYTVSLVQWVQPFASCLGGQWFTSGGCTNSQLNRVSPIGTFLLQWIHNVLKHRIRRNMKCEAASRQLGMFFHPVTLGMSIFADHFVSSKNGYYTMNEKFHSKMSPQTSTTPKFLGQLKSKYKISFPILITVYLQSSSLIAKLPPSILILPLHIR